MEFEVPETHILRPTLFTDIVQHVLRGRGKSGALVEKKQGPMVERCYYNDVLIFNFDFFKKNWGGFFFSFQNCLFWTYIKSSPRSLFGACSFLLIHIGFTPSEGPKGFLNRFLKKPNYGSWTMKSYHESWTTKSYPRKRPPPSLIRLHGPWCKPTLRTTTSSSDNQRYLTR